MITVIHLCCAVQVCRRNDHRTEHDGHLRVACWGSTHQLLMRATHLGVQAQPRLNSPSQIAPPWTLVDIDHALALRSTRHTPMPSHATQSSSIQMLTEHTGFGGLRQVANAPCSRSRALQLAQSCPCNQHASYSSGFKTQQLCRPCPSPSSAIVSIKHQVDTASLDLWKKCKKFASLGNHHRPQAAREVPLFTGHSSQNLWSCRGKAGAVQAEAGIASHKPHLELGHACHT